MRVIGRAYSGGYIILNSPLETINIDSTSYKYWIPAFAGMTPVGLNPKPWYSPNPLQRESR